MRTLFPLGLVCVIGLCASAALLLGEPFPSPPIASTPFASPTAGSTASPAPFPSFTPPLPNPLPSLSPPRLPPTLRPVSRPDTAEVQRLTPQVQIWRAQALLPQIPQRRGNVVEPTYVTGTEPVALRLQFDRRAAGEKLLVIPAKGVVLSPPDSVLTVSSTGECIVSVQLVEGAYRGHIIFYCHAVKTIVPVYRASLSKVLRQETATGGRP